MPAVVRILVRFGGEASTSLPAPVELLHREDWRDCDSRRLPHGMRAGKHRSGASLAAGTESTAVAIGPVCGRASEIAGVSETPSYSLRTSIARLSSRSPMNRLCRRCPSGVHSTNSNWPTSDG